MNFKYLKNRQYSIFYLFFCFLLLSCSHNLRREPAPVMASENVAPEISGSLKVPVSETKFIYLKPYNSLQFLPESVNEVEIESEESAFPDKQFRQFTLKNGLISHYLPRNNLPGVSIAVIVEAGKYQFNAKDEQLSPLVLKLLKQGTKKYPKSDFQKRVSLLGKPINYWQNAQYSVLSAEILPQDLEFALDLLAQQLAYIKPDSDALRKVVEQQLLENKLTQSAGSNLAKLLFYQNNYPPGHLYYQLQANSDEIKKLSKEDLMDFYQRKYTPQRSRIIISGDIEPKHMRKLVMAYFSDWTSTLNKDSEKKSGFSRQEIPESVQLELLVKNSESHFDFIERKGAQQVDLLYGVVTVPRLSSDWLGLKIIASLIGGGPNSRLFADLREKQGLAYFISARQLAGRYSSPFFIQTSVAHKKLIAAINGINKHLNYLCHNKIDEQELRQIKQQLSGEIIFKLQTNGQMVNNKIRQLKNALENDYLVAQKRKINNITAEQLFVIANKYLCGKHNFIAVGQKNKLGKTFRQELKDYIYQEHHLPLH